MCCVCRLRWTPPAAPQLTGLRGAAPQAIRDLTPLVLGRALKLCNFLDYQDIKVPAGPGPPRARPPRGPQRARRA